MAEEGRAHGLLTPETAGPWPSGAAVHLLRAAVVPAAEALVALDAWKAEAGYAHYEDLDVPTIRLLARVGRRLDAQLPDDAWTPRMRGLCRHAWMRDAVRYRHMTTALHALGATGIPFVLLKGEALLTGGIVPRDGRRVMGDTDISVHSEDLPRIHDVLAGLGWRASSSPHPGAKKRHAIVWSGSSGFGMDVHRRVFPVPFRFHGLDELLPGARPCPLAGRDVLVPDSTHLLLVACVNGRKHDGVGSPPLEWVADVWDLVHERDHPVDWNALLARADRYDVLLPVREALTYVRRTLAAPIPDDWLARARVTPLRGSGVRAFELHAGRPPALRMPRRTLLELWDAYRGRAENAGRRPTTAGWLAYVARRALTRGPRSLGRAWRRWRAEGLHAFDSPVGLPRNLQRVARRL